MGPHDRKQFVDQLEACVMCTSWQHSANTCKVRSKSNCPVITSGTVCGLRHHRLLHDSGTSSRDINIAHIVKNELELELNNSIVRGSTEQILSLSTISSR